LLKASAGTWLNYGTTVALQVVFAAVLGTSANAAAFQFSYALAIAGFGAFVSTIQVLVVPRALDGEGHYRRSAVGSARNLILAGCSIFLVVGLAAGPIASEVAAAGGLTAGELEETLRLAAVFGMLEVAAGGATALALARGRRFLPAVAPAAPTAVGALWLAASGSNSAAALLAAFSVGALIQLAVACFAARAPISPVSGQHDRLGRLAVPVVAQYALIAGVAPLEIFVAASHSAADGSHWAYAVRGLGVAQQLLIGGLVLSALGDWSALRGEKPQLAVKLAAASAIVAALLAVACVTAVLFGRDLIELLFQRGAFHANDTTAVFRLVCLALPGFAFESASLVLSQAIVAVRRNDLAVRTGFIRTVVRIVLLVVLGLSWGPAGVAVAWSVSAAVGLLLNARYLVKLELAQWHAVTAGVWRVAPPCLGALVAAAACVVLDVPVPVRAALVACAGGIWLLVVRRPMLRWFA